MDVLIYSVVLVISVLAVICVIKFLCAVFFENKAKLLCFFTLVPVYDNDEDIEYTIRSILWSRNWERNTNQHIILVMKNCEKEIVELCEKICEEYEPVSMCSPEQLAELVDDPQSAVTKIWYTKGMN